MISRRSLLPLLPALALVHCASPKPPAVVTLTMIRPLRSDLLKIRLPLFDVPP